MDKEELQKEYNKLNSKQKDALRKRFYGKSAIYLEYNNLTDALVFNTLVTIKGVTKEYRYFGYLTRSGKLSDLRRFEVVNGVLEHLL